MYIGTRTRYSVLNMNPDLNKTDKMRRIVYVLLHKETDRKTKFNNTITHYSDSKQILIRCCSSSFIPRIVCKQNITIFKFWFVYGMVRYGDISPTIEMSMPPRYHSCGYNYALFDGNFLSSYGRQKTPNEY